VTTNNLTDSTHLNVGKEDNNIVLLFSCPGQMEEDLKKPVACQTGINLNMLLKILHEEKNDVFKYTNRYDYRITNTWNKVEYQAKTGRTEAPLKKIKESRNLERLEQELEYKKTLILFGKNAKSIKNLLNFNGIIIESRHLSFQSINQIDKDSNGNILQKKQKDNTKKRLIVIAKQILKQYEEQSPTSN
jgi:hypothetical protein